MRVICLAQNVDDTKIEMVLEAKILSSSENLKPKESNSFSRKSGPLLLAAFVVFKKQMFEYSNLRHKQAVLPTDSTGEDAECDLPFSSVDSKHTQAH